MAAISHTNWLKYADQAASHYLNQSWLDYRRIYGSLGLYELPDISDKMCLYLLPMPSSRYWAMLGCLAADDDWWWQKDDDDHDGVNCRNNDYYEDDCYDVHGVDNDRTYDSENSIIDMRLF